MAEGKRTLPSTILGDVSGGEGVGGGVGLLFVYFHGVLVPEGGLADEEFVDEDAKGPPVDCGSVACLCELEPVAWDDTTHLCS